MGKLFAQSPSDYIGIASHETVMRTAIDMACAGAYWTDEGQKYNESQKNAGRENLAIGEELKRYQEEMNSR